MTKIELAREVAVSEHLHLSTAVKAIDGTLRIICETLAKGDSIALRGFGTIIPVQCKERPARDFRTGSPCVVPAHRSVKLMASKQLVKYLNPDEGKEADL